MVISDSLLDLLVSFLHVEYLEYWFFPLLALAFVATIPVIIKRLFRWG